MFIPNVTSTVSSRQFRQVVEKEPTRALNVEEVQMILTDETKDLSIPMHVTEGTSEDRRGVVQTVCHALLHDARLSTSVPQTGSTDRMHGSVPLRSTARSTYCNSRRPEAFFNHQHFSGRMFTPVPYSPAATGATGDVREISACACSRTETSSFQNQVVAQGVRRSICTPKRGERRERQVARRSVIS